MGADVDIAGAAIEGGEVVGEAFPGEIQPFMQSGGGDVFHPLHQLDELVVIAGADRGEADAAIAHDGGGDAMQRGGGEVGVPDRLAVVMSVDIDVAGGDEVAGGVDLLRAGAVDLADGGDAAIGDGEVAGIAGRTGAVDDAAVADDEIVCGHVAPRQNACRELRGIAALRPAFSWGPGDNG